MTELHRVSAEQYAKMAKTPLVVVLDNVRSEMNVGSILRTADAFAVERVVLCGITATPPRPEIHKTALGAEDNALGLLRHGPRGRAAAQGTGLRGVCH